jgi:hypothetical protein
VVSKILCIVNSPSHLLQPQRENCNYECNLLKIQCFTCKEYGHYSRHSTKIISPEGAFLSKGDTKCEVHVNLIEVWYDVSKKAITKYEGSREKK